jgi:hypothetical protein
VVRQKYTIITLVVKMGSSKTKIAEGITMGPCGSCKGAGGWSIGDCEEGCWECCPECEGVGETEIMSEDGDE